MLYVIVFNYWKWKGCVKIWLFYNSCVIDRRFNGAADQHVKFGSEK
jgi:hypothetical protein